MRRRINPQHKLYRAGCLLLVVCAIVLVAPGRSSHAQDLNATISAGYAAVFSYAQQVLSSSAGQVGSPGNGTISTSLVVPSFPSSSIFTNTSGTGFNFTTTFGTPFGFSTSIQPSMFSNWFSGYPTP